MATPLQNTLSRTLMNGNLTINGNISVNSTNIALGLNAAAGTVGTNSIAIGQSAGQTYIGNYNVAVGYQSCFNQQGQYNTYIGHQAGYNSGFSNVGTSNTTIGYNSNAGTYQNCIAIGAGAVCTGDSGIAIGVSVSAAANQIVLGPSNATVSIPGSLKLGSTDTNSVSVSISTAPNNVYYIGASTSSITFAAGMQNGTIIYFRRVSAGSNISLIATSQAVVPPNTSSGFGYTWNSGSYNLIVTFYNVNCYVMYAS